MNRRTFLLVAAVGATSASGGCLASLDAPFGDSPITDRSLTILDPEDDGDDRAALNEPPQVTFDEANGRVVVTGSFFVGSSSCNRAVLDEASYERSSDTLTVGLTSGRQEGAGTACSADESADHYRLVVTFEDDLPGRVEVSEGDDPSGQTTVVRRG